MTLLLSFPSVSRGHVAFAALMLAPVGLGAQAAQLLGSHRAAPRAGKANTWVVDVLVPQDPGVMQRSIEICAVRAKVN